MLNLGKVFFFFFPLQVLETIACYPENMEAKELRRILTQPHFMVGELLMILVWAYWCVIGNLRPRVSDMALFDNQRNSLSHKAA